jgi:surface protein
MTIADQITRLNNAKAAIKQSIENKGVEVSDTALLDEYPALIDSIEAGGGDSTDSSYYYVYLSRTQNETNYSELFKSCNNLTELDLSNWDTSNVTTMYQMFYNCYYLTSLDLSNWNTGEVTNMYQMFNDCINLSKINGIENLDTSKVTNMSQMFNYDAKLITLDLSNWNTSKVTNMGYMFNYCSNLEEVDLRNFNISNTTNVSGMFGGCYELRTLRLDNCNNATISKIVNSAALPTMNLGDGTMRKIYCKQENITGLTAPKSWVFVDYMTGEEIVPEMPEEPDVSLYVPGEFSNKSDITEVRTMVNDTHTSLGSMFNSCINLASIIGIEDWDTSNVTDMSYMFNYCAKLITLDLSNFDTSKVTDMSFMFNSCTNLEEVDLRNFDMTNTTNAKGMFSTCYELRTLRLDNCSNATINKIITSNYIQTGTVNGTTRKIYCKEANASGLTAPNGWEFIFVE